MPRRAGGGGVLDGGGGGSGTVGNSPPRREVEVTVYDRLLNEVRAFRCDQHLLETSMAYFEPIIRHYLEEEEQQHENDAQRQEGRRHGLCGDSKKTHASTTTATSTTAAAVTRTTSNNTNNYHNTSTGDVSRGRNEADARRGEEDDLEGSGSCRRSGASSLPPIPLRVNCDLDIFSWLMSYVEGKMRPFTPENAVSIALSSNFLLMTELVDLPLQYIKENLVQVMLSGVNMECLTGELLARLCNMLSDGDITRAFLELYDWRAEYTSNRRFLTALLRHMVSVRLSDKRSTGLRWCQYCGVLFDEYELHRLERNGKNVKPVLCPRLTNNFIGTRGEILSTHVASKHPVNLPFPSLAWSDEHVERWAWRIIGAMHFFLCRQCNHLVPLIDTITHGCSGGVASFTCIEDANRAGSEALLAWFGASKGFYSGGLTPMYSHQTDIPRELVLTLSSTGEWISETGDERPIPGLWCTHPVAVERSVDKKGRVNVDTLNGFERWLVEELQQMMEEFGEGRQRSSFANQTHMDAATRALIPGMSVMTTEASHNNNNNNNNHHHHHSLPPAVILGNRGGGGESSNESLYMRTSYRGNRGDGRSGVNTRNDGLPKRREMSSAANGVGQRMKIASGGANMTHDSNKVTTNFTFASPLRVKSAQPVRPSMQSLAMLGRGSPVSSQMQR